MGLDHLSKIVVWLRLMGLPFRYYMKSIFCIIVGSVGKIVNIDVNASKGLRGKFTRLAVVVDFDESMPSCLIIDGVKQRIEYEGLPTICFSCGKYDHLTTNCKPEQVVVTRAKERGNSYLAMLEMGEKFGPWIQVQGHKPRQIAHVQNNQYVGGTPSTSMGLGRFVALAIDDGSHDAVKSSAGENQEIRSGVDKNTLPAPNLTSFNVGESSKNCKVWGTTGRVGNGAEGLTTTLPAKELGSGKGKVESKLKSSSKKVVDQCRLDDFLPLTERKEGGKKLTGPFRVQRLSKVKGDARSIVQIDLSENGDTQFSFNCHISFVYASRDSRRQSHLWDQMKALNPGSNVPWVLGGDSNSILLASKRMGRFSEMKWSMFLRCLVRGPRVIRSFRYLVAWQNDPSFVHLLKECWRPTRRIAINLKNFREVARSWNVEEFGSIGKCKRHLMARIEGIERAMEFSVCDRLKDLKYCLKCDWIWCFNRKKVYGSNDRGVNRFKMEIIIQKCIKEGVVGFLKRLFTANTATPVVWAHRGFFKGVDGPSRLLLSREIGIEEVRSAVFSMGPLKAPSVDGIHVIFYQQNWEIVSSYVVDFV
ncbi:hypothetical protein GQ457_15G014170 [Hibiscus cannabinus]